VQVSHLPALPERERREWGDDRHWKRGYMIEINVESIQLYTGSHTIPKSYFNNSVFLPLT